MSEGRKPAQNLPSETGGRLPPTPGSDTTAPLNWDCKFAKAENGPELSALTVGAKFILHCEGASISPWTTAPALGFAKPEDEYSLAVLAINNAGPNSADFVVTGYKPGNYSGLITIGTGSNQVKVSGLNWQVQTAIEAKEGQPPKPYPPYGPLTLHWPWWLWTSIGMVILAVAVAVGWRLRRQMARKRLIEKIKAGGSVLSPYAQLHKDLRALLRRYEGLRHTDQDHRPEEYLLKLNESFRNYMSRQLLVSANEWSDAAIARDLLKHHKPLYKRQGQDIYALLRELKRAQYAKSPSFTDCHQLHEMCRKQADKIESQKGDGK